MTESILWKKKRMIVSSRQLHDHEFQGALKKKSYFKHIYANRKFRTGAKDRIQMRKENLKHVKTGCAKEKFGIVEEH